MAAHDHAGMRIEARLVEAVRHFSNQSPGGPNWQASVVVQRDDKANTGRKRRYMAVDGHERRIGSAAKETVELVQFASLALPAHPHFLTRVPDTPTVKKKETCATAF